MGAPARNRRAQLPAPDPATLAAAEPGYRIAGEPLFLAGGVLAHVAGDRVPLDNVARHGWQDKVLMPPPDPPPHVAADLSADTEPSDVDGGDGKSGRPAQP